MIVINNRPRLLVSSERTWPLFCFAVSHFRLSAILRNPTISAESTQLHQKQTNKQTFQQHFSANVRRAAAGDAIDRSFVSPLAHDCNVLMQFVV